MRPSRAGEHAAAAVPSERHGGEGDEASTCERHILMGWTATSHREETRTPPWWVGHHSRTIGHKLLARLPDSCSSGRPSPLPLSPPPPAPLVADRRTCDVPWCTDMMSLISASPLITSAYLASAPAPRVVSRAATKMAFIDTL